MKILIVGASGTIGSAVTKDLSARHEVVTAGSSSGDVQFDMTNADSVRAAFEKAGKFDAIVVCAGRAKMLPLSEFTEQDFQFCLQNKLMGQVNIVQQGAEFLSNNGSFTLTSGFLWNDPVLAGTGLAMANGALNSFVISAAIELPRGIRINVVAPPVVAESLEVYGPYFPGIKAVPAATLALAYCKSVEGAQTGQVYYAP